MKKFLAYTISAIVGFCVLGPFGLIIALVLAWLVLKQS